MRVFLGLAILILFVTSLCFAQNAGASLTVIDSGWKRIQDVSKRVEPEPGGPARAMIAENKKFVKSARDNLAPGAPDINEQTVDGRSLQLEKMSREASTPQPDPKVGYRYFAIVKNEGQRTIDIVFWEYRFAELANPANIVRRQFLCGGTIKPGQQKELFAVSLLAPSEVVSAESLAKATEKIFDEKVIINRIEYSDGGVLQRQNWKYDDYQDAIKRVTSTPWGRDVCRSL